MKILKIILIAIALIIVGFFIYKNFRDNGFFMSKEEKYFYKKLKEFKDSGEDSIELREMTNFEWDSVNAFSSYSPLEGGTSLIFHSNGDKIISIKGYQKIFQRQIGGHDSLFMFAKQGDQNNDLSIKIENLKWKIAQYEVYGIRIY